MRLLFLLAPILLIGSASANAACFGSSYFQNCFDNAGNAYTVQRFGNQTYLNGWNSRTGSTWSQNSLDLGSTTLLNGYTNGRTWSGTVQDFGGTQMLYGRDSYGNSFGYTCNRFGCW